MRTSLGVQALPGAGNVATCIGLPQPNASAVNGLSTTENLPCGYRFGRPALWTVLVVVLELVLDLAGFDYDYENDDEEDALRVCRRFTPAEAVQAPQPVVEYTLRYGLMQKTALSHRLPHHLQQRLDAPGDAGGIGGE